MGTGKYSPYEIAENEPVAWKPGEELAAAAFVGAAIFIVIDVNVGIWRVFKRKRGLYYWSMFLGILFCFVDAVGVILKFLTLNTKHVWGLYTALLLCGWSVYAPAQLLVLYSRLHLVNDSYKTQRWVFYMIISTFFFLIIPTWVVVWPAYDIDPKVSSLWSPRDAIVERYNQIGFTLVECVISGVYIWSLLGLLNLKSSVRQRRVMLDLIYVNLIILSFDFAVVILLYLNQTGISHPIQTFSYAVKLKIEFVVLNQLMAVAARGLQKENFEERRYHHGSTTDAFSAECREWDKKQPGAASDQSRSNRQGDQDLSHSTGSFQLTVPSPVLSKQHQTPKTSATKRIPEEPRSHPAALQKPNEDRTHDHEKLDEDIFQPEQDRHLESFLDDDDAVDGDETDAIRHKPSEAFSGETLRPREETAREDSSHLHPRRVSQGKGQAPQSHSRSRGQHRQLRRQHDDQQHGSELEKTKTRGTIKRRIPKNGRHSKGDDDDDDDDEEEIGVHMWENRKGSLMMEVPWFKSKAEPSG